MFMFRRVFILPCWISALLMLASAGCGSDDSGDGGGGDGGGSGGDQQLDLVIGDIIPLTGDLSDFGPSLRKSADLAVQEINAAVEQVGADHTVSVLHEDTQSVPQSAVEAARTVVGDGASCILGALGSASTLPVARSVATREEVLQISYASTSDEISDLNDNGLVNRTLLPNSEQGIALAAAIGESLGGAEGMTVNLGIRNDAGNVSLADAFVTAWEERGGTIGARADYDPEQPTYNAEAQQIVSGDPDAFLISDFPENYGRVSNALERTGEWDPSITFVPDALASDSLPEDVGEEATEGLRGTLPGVPDDADATAAFESLFDEADGPELGIYNAQAFDAAILCYLAAVAAGSTEGSDMADTLQAVSAPPGDPFTFEQLPQAIQALQDGADIDYQGVSGALDLNGAGDPESGVYDIWTFEDGDVTIIDAVRFEGGEPVE